MAVAPIPLLKSQPDMSKLNAFAGYMVSVTKHLGPKGTPGTAVVPTQKMPLDQLLALQVHLPLKYNAGYYMFTVTDEGGTGSDEWMVKLGTEVAPTQEGLSMGQPPYMQQPPGTPLDPGVTQIMPGFFYNEALGLLTTPWRETVAWRTNDPWPKPPASVSAGHLSLVPPNATPFNWQQQPGGWGSWPATEAKSPELEALKLQMAEDRRRSEEADRRREDREREDRRAEDAKRDREAAEARWEKMITLLSAKPSGPTETEQRLLREAEETRRRLEDSERRAAEDRKEAQRQADQRASEERHNEQMRLMREEIKAATANKADPMMQLFGTILSTQSTSATENARMIREAGDRAAAASERNTTQILELARAQREGSAESGKAVLDGMKGLMDTSTTFYQQMLEVAGNSGGQPWYAGVLQEGIGKIGLLGQAILEKNQQAQQAQFAPQQRIVQGRPVPGQPMARPMPGQPPVPQVTAGAGPINTGTRPPDADYDSLTEEFVFPDGWRVKQAVVQQHGWLAVLKRRPPAGMVAPVVAAAPAPVVPVNGATAAPVAGAPPPIVVEVLPPPAKPAKATKGNKNKKKRAAAPEPEPEDDEVPLAIPPPANGVAYSVEEIRAMEPEQVEEVVRVLDDAKLFGALLPYVIDLRAKAAKGLSVAKAVEFILGTRQYINSFGDSPPPAFELMAAEQLEVLVGRLLPDAPEEYQDAILDDIEKQLEAENPQRAEIEAQ